MMENGNKSIEPLTDKFCFKPCSPNCEHQKFRIICMKFIFLLWAVSTCKCTARKVKEYFRKNTQKGYENLIFLLGDGLFFQQLC